MRVTFVLLAITLSAPGVPGPHPASTASTFGFEVVHVYPHDPTAFTQGLEFSQGFLYEGTGLNGRSALRKIKLETGEIVAQTLLAPAFFGEGITVLDNRVLQLTWQGHRGFVYSSSPDSRAGFRLLTTFAYPGEGWGLAHDGSFVYLSDGSAELRCLNTSTLQEVKRISVHDGDQPIELLNELECVKGEIYANVWHSNHIARIAPDTGRVTAWIDLTGLISPAELINREAVLNGIAYDAGQNRLFVTGKLWPKLFEIRLVAR